MLNSLVPHPPVEGVCRVSSSVSKQECYSLCVSLSQSYAANDDTGEMGTLDSATGKYGLTFSGFG
jgi:hypothetical protein